MASIEINASSSQCRKCGSAYGRLKGNFPVSYAQLYKGQGYMPYCRECVDGMYDAYYALCKDSRAAVRQMCRKLDLYWDESVYQYAELRAANRSMMTAYIARSNSVSYAGKSYDDTLIEENALWSGLIPNVEKAIEIDDDPIKDIQLEADPELADFWGADYSPEFLIRLDKRYRKWTKDQGELEPGSVSLFKHICILEETIATDSAAGRPVDKNVNTLNSLLGSLNLKPAQKKDDSVNGAVDNSPMGVWIRRFENERPIPEVDPELRDVDKIVHYIQVFFLGHLAKMLGKTTVYSKMYEKEIARLRVEDPALSGEYEDDEEFFENRFAVEDGDES